MLKLEKELVKFLIKKSIVLRFRRNLKDHKLGIIRKGVNIRCSRLLKSFEPENYIKSFRWENTKEGVMFWSKINKEWKKELKT